TYQWDQMDTGTSTTAITHGTDNGSNALFRSFLPVASAERTFPQLSTLLGNNPDVLAARAETLPTENRTLNFRFTVRDGNGGVDEDDMQVIVDGDSGPFEILQPNTNVILNSGLPQLIEWNTACTDIAPVNCTNVDILLSTDGGQNFTSVVGGTTPNDGSQSVTFPGGDTTTARIKIACTDNIFFDVSNVDFEINSATGGNLTATGIAPSCGTATGVGDTGDEIEPNNYLAQAQSLTSPTTLNGTVNDKLDPDDVFVFVANNVTYTITLNFLDTGDLDLYLLDSTGNDINNSISYDSSTETITQNLVAGETYYIVVNGWETFSTNMAYSLSIQEKAISSGGGGGIVSYYWLFVLLITPLLRLQRKITLS
ncbi:MAG: PPC domain-containing protein, partial [Gammaproteobacteria bacterium]|nr:PPC domain-containing protein [Gammaproteobacteria bacterium]